MAIVESAGAADKLKAKFDALQNKLMTGLDGLIAKAEDAVAAKIKQLLDDIGALKLLQVCTGPAPKAITN